jgi:hypothetical protein
MARLQDGSGGVDDTNDGGIWSDRSGSLDLVVRKGAHAPGTESGVSFDSFSYVATINAAGRICFTATLAGLGTAAQNNLGLWAEDRAGNLNLIARAGQSFHIGPNDDRIVAEIWKPAVPSGRSVSFNERFTLAFILLFTDGSKAIYTASLPSLPGDFDGNGIVDTADYLVWRKSSGQSGVGLAADGDNNGTIDAADFALWRANYGASAAGSSSIAPNIPEPASLLLIFAAAAASSLTVRRARLVA